jgi:hypothetical protein
VHDDGDTIEEAELPVRAATNGHAKRCIPKGSAEGGDVAWLKLAGDEDTVQSAVDEFLGAEGAGVGWGNGYVDFGVAGWRLILFLSEI